MNRPTTRAANAASAMKRAGTAGLERKPLASSLCACAPSEPCRAFLNIEPSKPLACADSVAERKDSISIGVVGHKEVANAGRILLEHVSAGGF
jgi:hypothetical protein